MFPRTWAANLTDEDVEDVICVIGTRQKEMENSHVSWLHGACLMVCPDARYVLLPNHEQCRIV